MEELDYRTRFFIKMTVIWVAIIIIQYRAKGSPNDAPLDFTTFVMIGFFLSIWLAAFCAQGAFLRFFFLKSPLELFSLPELLISIVFSIVSFVVVYFTSTVFVALGSPLSLLFFGVFENSAEIKRQARFLLLWITLLLFYMHVCILRYDEDIEDTENAKLIRIVTQACLAGVIINGLAGSVFLWFYWFCFMLIPPVIMRFILLRSTTTNTRNNVLLFFASYGLMSIPFYFFNNTPYIPSAIVFVKSLMSFGFGNRYYPLSSALFNITSSALLLFFLYRMHSGILGYEEER